MEQVLNITKGAFNTLMKTFNKTCALCLFIPAEEDNLCNISKLACVFTFKVQEFIKC